MQDTQLAEVYHRLKQSRMSSLINVLILVSE